MGVCAISLILVKLDGKLSEALFALPRTVQEVHLESNEFVEVTTTRSIKF